MKDNYVIKERATIELFFRLLLAWAEKDEVKCEHIRDMKRDNWAENSSYFNGRSHGIRQAVEEMRSFMETDEGQSFAKALESNPLNIMEDDDVPF